MVQVLELTSAGAMSGLVDMLVYLLTLLNSGMVHLGLKQQNDLNTGKQEEGSGAGTSTAGLFWLVLVKTITMFKLTESWNGTLGQK